MNDDEDPFDFNGSLGNSNFREDSGKRKKASSGKGGPTTDQFKNSDSYLFARERSLEFGGRSKWASLFKSGFSDISQLMYAYCFNQIMAIGRLIQEKDDENDHGNRMIAVKNYPGALALIEFNEKHPFKSLVRFSKEIIFSPDKKTVTLNIREFISERDARWVKKFYAMRFYLVMTQVADMAWVADSKSYQPVVEYLEVLSKCTDSEWLVRNSTPVTVTLETSFDEPAFTLPGTAVVVAIGVEFSTSVISGKPSVNPGSGSLAIVGCFTE